MRTCSICGIEYQTRDERNSITTTCSSNCRGHWYRNKHAREDIQQAIENNDYSIVRRFTLKYIIKMGFQVKILSPLQVPEQESS